MTETASASLWMPAASPRRQASPEDITLTSARTARRRQTLAGLGSRHGHLGSGGQEEDEEQGGAAKEAVVTDMVVAVGTRI